MLDNALTAPVDSSVMPQPYLRAFEVLRLNVFILTFLFGMGYFIGVNIYSYYQAVPPCCDASVSFGVPFEAGRIGGFVGVTSIRGAGLLANALIAFGASLILAWAFEKLFKSRIRLP
jgi:hypothetical protein